MILKISGDWGNLVLFNICNDCNHDYTIRELVNFHRAH